MGGLGAHTTSATFFSDYSNSIASICRAADDKVLASVADLVIETDGASKKVIIVGNGGSAGIASHVAVDFAKAAKVRAINFNEAGLLTCFSNDYGYDQWVVEALSIYADVGDLAILISSSGKSPNVIAGARKAKEMGLRVVTLTGFNGNNQLRTLGDINLWADSSNYNFVEMAHHIWLVAIVDYVIAGKLRAGT